MQAWCHQNLRRQKSQWSCGKAEKINELLVEQAQQGQRVLRLKGGDLYVFWAGGEEAEQLVAAGIEFEVVPGITAATAAASCTGIPLTHRAYAHSVKFVTASLKTDTINEDFTSWLDDNQTVVFIWG